MFSAPASTFPHRKNRDGSYDAICTECFQTVASVSEESDLAAFEDAHVCDPENQFAARQSRLIVYQTRNVYTAQ
jgi:hypothetical protein